MTANIPEDTPAVAINSWGWSLTGAARSENQDSFLNWPQRLLWAVADGVGGGVDGGRASRLVIERLLEVPGADSWERQVAAVKKALVDANQELWRQRSAAGYCATTATVLMMREGAAACLWAGDSRCYMLRQGVFYQCTNDHTLRQEQIDKGRLSIPEAQRMVSGNIITRAVGIRERLELEQVDFRLEPRDRFLLCTDGLSGILSANTLADALRRGVNAKAVSQDLSRLIDNQRQKDNITQITIFFVRA